MQKFPRVFTQEVPRLQRPPRHHSEIMPVPSSKAIKKRKKRKAEARLTVIPTDPAHNTRSRTKPADPAVTRIRATATSIELATTIPAPRASASASRNKTGNINRKSRIPQPTLSSRLKTRTGHAEAVEAHNKRQLMRQMTKRSPKLKIKSIRKWQ